MMGSVWPGQDPHQKFYGVIIKRMRYKGRKGEVVDGYEVRWDDGEKERWPYQYLLAALVETGEQLIGDDRDSLESESESENESDSVDEREDPEGFEYQNMFCTSSTGEERH